MIDRNEDQDIPPELWPVFDPWVDEAVELATRRMTPGRAVEVQRRMATDAMYRTVVEPVLESFDAPPLPDEERARMWEGFLKRRYERAIGERLRHEPAESVADRRKRLMKAFLKALGSIAIVGAGAVGLWLHVEISYHDQLTAAPADTVVRALPDGSIARIAPSSWLQYPERMKDIRGETSREVHMRGTASFETQAGANPWLEVYAGQARIVGAGARFTVEERDSVTTVSVSAGRVTVQPVDEWDKGTGRIVALRAGQSARVVQGEVVMVSPATAPAGGTPR